MQTKTHKPPIEQVRKWVRDAFKLSPRNQRPDRLAQRAELAKLIRERQYRGRVYLYFRARDCDGFTFEGTRELPAQVMAIENWLHRWHEYADGPMLERYLMTRGEYVEHEKARGRFDAARALA